MFDRTNFHKMAKLLPHYSNIKSFKSRVINNECSDVPQADELIRYLFAPDPLTGLPSSEIAAIYSKDLSPEIRDYINSTLLKAQNFPAGSDDADTALDLIKDRRESVIEYADRIRAMLNSKTD